MDQGLPQISVLSITQGRRGYQWVGTQSGIARFDGNRFTVYDRTTSGVGTTNADVSLAAADDSIWFGTPRGLLKIEGETVTALDSGSMTSVIGLAQTVDRRLLAASKSGVYAVDHDRLVAIANLTTSSASTISMDTHAGMRSSWC